MKLTTVVILALFICDASAYATCTKSEARKHAYAQCNTEYNTHKNADNNYYNSCRHSSAGRSSRGNCIQLDAAKRAAHHNLTACLHSNWNCDND